MRDPVHAVPLNNNVRRMSAHMKCDHHLLRLFPTSASSSRGAVGATPFDGFQRPTSRGIETTFGFSAPATSRTSSDRRHSIRQLSLLPPACVSMLFSSTTASLSLGSRIMAVTHKASIMVSAHRRGYSPQLRRDSFGIYGERPIAFAVSHPFYAIPQFQHAPNNALSLGR